MVCEISDELLLLQTKRWSLGDKEDTKASGKLQSTAINRIIREKKFESKDLSHISILFFFTNQIGSIQGCSQTITAISYNLYLQPRCKGFLYVKGLIPYLPYKMCIFRTEGSVV